MGLGAAVNWKREGDDRDIVDVLHGYGMEFPRLSDIADETERLQKRLALAEAVCSAVAEIFSPRDWLIIAEVISEDDWQRIAGPLAEWRDADR